MEMAHEGMIWSLAWHPLGHILCSGSNDHTRYSQKRKDLRECVYTRKVRGIREQRIDWDDSDTQPVCKAVTQTYLNG